LCGTVPSAPDLVISIVCHETVGRAIECLRTLHADPGRQTSIAVVVLDNVSSTPVAESIAEEFPDVRVLTPADRSGFGANHNAVIRATDSRYILVLNDDTTVPAGAIDALVAYMDAHPRVAAAGPRIVHDDGTPQPAAFRFPSPAATALFAATLGQVGMVQSGRTSPGAVDWIGGSAMLLRRSALDRVGLFDEGYFMYHEETDLCRRLHYAGFEVHYCPQVSVVHDHWGSSTDVPYRRVDEAHRSRRRYWRKHHGPVGVRIAPLLDAYRYLAAALVARLVGVVPARFRPGMAREWDAAVFAYNARAALGRTPGVGMREAAEEFNRARRADNRA
jgi:N-acetylglucosaminyl-diphospho-decaprenol L-rhamnosyltransferase